MKAWFEGVIVVLAGALLGSLMGKIVAASFPAGRVRDFLSTDISAGLRPATLDLQVVEVTVGCLFRFNVLSVAGIVLAAVLYKKVTR